MFADFSISLTPMGARVEQDLTYITDNVIAMGFPASGVEATYRNDIGHVAEMLNSTSCSSTPSPNCLPSFLLSCCSHEGMVSLLASQDGTSTTTWSGT